MIKRLFPSLLALCVLTACTDFKSEIITLTPVATATLTQVVATPQATLAPTELPTAVPPTAALAPQGLEFFGEVGAGAYAVALGGQYAYVGVGTQLLVVDVADPKAPTKVGGVSLGSTNVRSVVVSDTYAYTVDDSGLWVVDMTDPAAPIQVGAYSTKRIQALSVAVNGHYAYVGVAGGVRVVDVADPTRPVEVGLFTAPPAGAPYGGYGLAVRENYLYLPTWSGLDVLDVSNPTAPTRIDSHASDGFAVSVAVVGDYAYLAEAGGLRVWDVSDPTALVEVGRARSQSNAYSVIVVGHYAYLAEEYGKRLRVVDVADPTAPVEVGALALSRVPYALAVSGNYVYVANEGDGLRVVEVRDLTAPVEVGFYDGGDFEANGIYKYLATAGRLQAVVSGNYAYMAGGSAGGLAVLDITNPDAPEEVGVLSGAGRDVAVAGHYAYLADSAEGSLRVVDVANPMAPEEVGVYDVPLAAYPGATLADHFPDEVYGVAVHGEYVYVANGAGGLRVMNVADPQAPVEVGAYVMPFDGKPQNAQQVAVSGRYVYLADADRGLLVIDVTNPEQPVQVGAYEVLGGVYDVVVEGAYAYVATAAGVKILSVSDPTAPMVLATQALPNIARRLMLDGDLVYAVGGLDELWVLRVVR